MAEPTLYDRLGGVFAIAAVVNDFSDAIIRNAKVGELSENPQLREWSTKSIGRLPGLKFMRTLWVCNVAGGPFQYSPTVPGHDVLGLDEAHRRLRITPEEFDEVAFSKSSSGAVGHGNVAPTTPSTNGVRNLTRLRPSSASSIRDRQRGRPARDGVSGSPDDVAALPGSDARTPRPRRRSCGA